MYLLGSLSHFSTKIGLFCIFFSFCMLFKRYLIVYTLYSTVDICALANYAYKLNKYLCINKCFKTCMIFACKNKGHPH